MTNIQKNLHISEKAVPLHHLLKDASHSTTNKTTNILEELMGTEWNRLE